MPEKTPSANKFWTASGIGLLLTILWCILLGAGDPRASSLAFVVCSASFLSGSLFGFLFTIFGDELEPFGKIRDAVIAVVSGAAGIGLAKAKDIGSLIGDIRILSNDPDRNAPSQSCLS